MRHGAMDFLRWFQILGLQSGVANIFLQCTTWINLDVPQDIPKQFGHTRGSDARLG